MRWRSYAFEGCNVERVNSRLYEPHAPTLEITFYLLTIDLVVRIIESQGVVSCQKPAESRQVPSALPSVWHSLLRDCLLNVCRYRHRHSVKIVFCTQSSSVQSFIMVQKSLLYQGHVVVWLYIVHVSSYLRLVNDIRIMRQQQIMRLTSIR